MLDLHDWRIIDGCCNDGPIGWVERGQTNRFCRQPGYFGLDIFWVSVGVNVSYLAGAQVVHGLLDGPPRIQLRSVSTAHALLYVLHVRRAVSVRKKIGVGQFSARSVHRDPPTVLNAPI